MALSHAAALAALIAVFTGLAIIDHRRRILPNAIIYPGTVAALAAAPWLPAGGYATAAVGALGVFGLFAVLYVFRPTAMGAGDVKYAALIARHSVFPRP